MLLFSPRSLVSGVSIITLQDEAAQTPITAVSHVLVKYEKIRKRLDY